MQIMPFIWIGLAIVMAVCEAVTAQLVSIWFVLGAICAAITTIFTPSIIIQTTVFLAVSFIALIVTKPLVKKLRNNGNAQNTNADRLIGMVGVVVTDIDDEQSIGQVKVAGETWSARSDFAPILKDNRIKVLAIEGVKLIVEPISKERK
ncbi:MAG: NfeD family protein [Ruminococcus bromii]|nr:NfeD family protein [Ruminococcus bromii]MDY4711708.1 NfeD family protein [Ruminococcus bromii]